MIVEHAGRSFPLDPREQLDLAVRAVFDSWNTERAVIYRRQERIPADLGTAVNICSMVFGNLGSDSGTGVAFTRDPASGAQGIYGDYLQNAQGEDVVAGIRNTVPLADLEASTSASYDELVANMRTLEEHYRDLCDIEFTIERGKLWMLQTRVGKRTAGGGVPDRHPAGGSRPHRPDRGGQPGGRRPAGSTDVPALRRGRRGPAHRPGDRGLARGGGGQGGLRLGDRGRTRARRRGCRPGPPRDQPGRPQRHDRCGRHPDQPRRQDLPRGGGRARDGQDLRVRRRVTRRRREGGVVRAPGGVEIREGDTISIDGTSGDVFLGEVPVVPSPVMRYFEGEPSHGRGRRVGARRRPDHAARRRRAADVGAGERRHRRGRRPGPPVRRAGHRPVPYRAHVPRRAARAGRAADPRRHRRRTGGAS